MKEVLEEAWNPRSDRKFDRRRASWFEDVERQKDQRVKERQRSDWR